MGALPRVCHCASSKPSADLCSFSGCPNVVHTLAASHLDCFCQLKQELCAYMKVKSGYLWEVLTMLAFSVRDYHIKLQALKVVGQAGT